MLWASPWDRLWVRSYGNQLFAAQPAGSTECWGHGPVWAFWSMPGRGPVANMTVFPFPVCTDLPAALLGRTATTIIGWWRGHATAGMGAAGEDNVCKRVSLYPHIHTGTSLLCRGGADCSSHCPRHVVHPAAPGRIPVCPDRIPHRLVGRAETACGS